MNRLDFLMMTESLMLEIERIIDDSVPCADRDALVAELCDKVCEIMDPAGLE